MAYDESVPADNLAIPDIPGAIRQKGISVKELIDAHVNKTSGAHAASAINGLATVATSGSYNDLGDKPTSLLANGGNADTVNNCHADGRTDGTGLLRNGTDILIPVSFPLAANNGKAKVGRIITNPDGTFAIQLGGNSSNPFFQVVNKEGTISLLAVYNDGTCTINDKQLATIDQSTYIVSEYLGTNGYRKWSDGFIEQWGIIDNGSDGYSTINFNITFQHTVFGVILQRNKGTGDAFGSEIYPKVLSLSQFQLYYSNVSAYPVTWFAKGY